MNIFTAKNHYSISEYGESFNLDLDPENHTIHVWITLPSGGQSLMTVKFTEKGIQVEQ